MILLILEDGGWRNSTNSARLNPQGATWVACKERGVSNFGQNRAAELARLQLRTALVAWKEEKDAR
jgi:hypothetical protein